MMSNTDINSKKNCRVAQKKDSYPSIDRGSKTYPKGNQEELREYSQKSMSPQSIPIKRLSNINLTSSNMRDGNNK